MNKQQFDAPAELEKIRKRKIISRKKCYQFSRLKKLRTEIILLRETGASFREIRLWLRHTKRIKIAHTTIMRFLEKISKERENNYA